MRILFLTVAVLLCWAGTYLGLTVQDLGRQGKTHPIAEGDIAEPVRERASRLDLARLRNGLRGKARRFELPRELHETNLQNSGSYGRRGLMITVT
jgi:hypothetical protein